MNRDKLEGKGKEMAGGVKEQVGKATGNEETQAEGAAERTEGKAQGALGKAKDAAGDAVDAVKDAVKR